MTRASSWLAALLAALFLATASSAEGPVVILLSWDGVRHDYPDRAKVPALDRMAREGARAERLIPVFPSDTFPNHVSLATGTYPDRHGIVENRFWDRERGLFDYDDDASWIEAEPLWVAAERQGVRAAAFYWVGSQTDWRGVGATYRKAPFDGSIGEDEKVDQILAWLDLPAERRPGLIMSWWHGADQAGHRFGPDHPSVARQLEGQDAELGRLLAGLDARDVWGHTTLLVVSDHGMTAVRERVDVSDALTRAGIEARVLSHSSVAQVFLDDPGRRTDAEQVLSGMNGVRVHRQGDLPAELRLDHPSRTGDLVVLTDPPKTLRAPSWLQLGLAWIAKLRGRSIGLHGFSPEHPDMAAIFFALGRGVPAGARLGTVRNIDVAPTVAALLGIDPPAAAEGSPISVMVPNGRREE